MENQLIACLCRFSWQNLLLTFASSVLITPPRKWEETRCFWYVKWNLHAQSNSSLYSWLLKSLALFFGHKIPLKWKSKSHYSSIWNSMNHVFTRRVLLAIVVRALLTLNFAKSFVSGGNLLLLRPHKTKRVKANWRITLKRINDQREWEQHSFFFQMALLGNTL